MGVITQPRGSGVRRSGRVGGYPGAYNASITNLPTCGGNKKAGLAPQIGVPINILITKNYLANPPNCCKVGPGMCLTGKFGTVLNRPVQNTRTPYALIH